MLKLESAKTSMRFSIRAPHTRTRSTPAPHHIRNTPHPVKPLARLRHALLRAHRTQRSTNTLIHVRPKQTPARLRTPRAHTPKLLLQLTVLRKLLNQLLILLVAGKRNTQIIRNSRLHPVASPRSPVQRLHRNSLLPHTLRSLPGTLARSNLRGTNRRRKLTLTTSKLHLRPRARTQTTAAARLHTPELQ